MDNLIKKEPVDDPAQNMEEASGETRTDQYQTSGESMMTFSNTNRLLSFPAYESVSHSAPDRNKIKGFVRSNRRGRRSRKPEQPPKTHHSDEHLLKGGKEVENEKDSKKRIKILLPQKVSIDTLNGKTNIANLETSHTKNFLMHDKCRAIGASPNLNTSETKIRKSNRENTFCKNVRKPTDSSEKNTQENRSVLLEFVENVHFQIKNENFDIELSDKKIPSKENPVEDETTFYKKVSELCKDIKEANLGNKKKEDNVCKMKSSFKPTAMDDGMTDYFNKTTSDSSKTSDLLKSVVPSTSQDCGADSTIAKNMRAEMAIVKRRKKITENRRDAVRPKRFDASTKERIDKLIDEIGQIDELLAKEINKKDKYYHRGYKITHQILTNLQKFDKGHN